ncbi:MAG TPA: hypothetical protein PKC45_14790 [Gemmatales bacterium]|nr:hypothetical protein [Gemmatales bacterium]
MIRFACPACQKVYKAEDGHAGRKTVCKSCGAIVVVPEQQVREVLYGTALPPEAVVETTPEPAAELPVSGGRPEPTRQRGKPLDLPPPDDPEVAEPSEDSGEYRPIRSRNRPLPPKVMVGVVLVWVFATCGLLWNLVALYHSLFGRPTMEELLLAELFPSLPLIQLLSAAAGELSHSLLLVGATLVYFRNPYGRPIVFLTCLATLAEATLATLLLLKVVVGSAQWIRLDPAFRGGFVGGAVGGLVACWIFYILVLYLFGGRERLRRYRY